MQKTFINTISELAQINENVLYLGADNGTDFDALFKRSFPKQYFDLGIAENNLVGVASGLASCSKIPFVYTAAPFLAYRSYEFIRVDACFQNLNVKFIGKESALSISKLGPTHHTTEDISVLRSLPNLTILSASTPIEFRCALLKAYEIVGPVYIRTELNLASEIHSEENFNILAQHTISDIQNEDITIFTTGTIFEEVIKAQRILKENNINAKLVQITSIKPFESTEFLSHIKNVKMVVSVEEHNVLGGLGSILSEIMTDNAQAKRLLRIGLDDTFAKGYATLDELRKMNRLDAYSISEKIISTLKQEEA